MDVALAGLNLAEGSDGKVTAKCYCPDSVRFWSGSIKTVPGQSSHPFPASPPFEYRIGLPDYFPKIDVDPALRIPVPGLNLICCLFVPHRHGHT